MQTYVFKYRRGLVTRRRVVQGHRYDQTIGKMVLYFPDGRLEEIPQWSKYRLWLGVDWVLAQKKILEQQAGVSVPVAGT